MIAARAEVPVLIGLVNVARGINRRCSGGILETIDSRQAQGRSRQERGRGRAGRTRLPARARSGPGSAGYVQPSAYAAMDQGMGRTLRVRSRSCWSWRATLSATSALAERNLAPWLSCVVDQMTSPSRLTRRTEAEASCLRSCIRICSFSPTAPCSPTKFRPDRAAEAPRPSERPARAVMESPDWKTSVNTRSSPDPRRMASARSGVSVSTKTRSRWTLAIIMSRSWDADSPPPNFST
ncbi:MAG: hypothetical protein C0504_01095 [Candidatus Solibacter sp.]|nr:hypothetical protein [Candidatus Solibacter sp.]